MTFIYIAKKITQKWLSNMAKDQMGQKLVVQENLSIQSARQAFLPKQLKETNQHNQECK